VLDNDGKLEFVLSIKSNDKATSWQDAQKWELAWWRDELKKKITGKLHRAEPTLDSVRLDIDASARKLVKSSVVSRVCLEIGAGPICGYIPYIEGAKKRVIIEPLAEEYDLLRKEINYEIPNLESVQFYPCAADHMVEELRGAVDGLIICQNALDHTPNWYFILSNISAYAAKGCVFYLWSDIDHMTPVVAGHFNITSNPVKLFDMVENFGFDLVFKKYFARDSSLVTISLVGVKK
jgi:hypothetical protein